MGFFKKSAESVADSLKAGDIDQAAKDYLYALQEGPGTATENASAMADAAAENRKGKRK